MKLITSLLILLSASFLNGCLYGQCINGPCALEHSRIVKSIKPYGAHWVKEGMTRESRRVDLTACGSISHEDVQFPAEQLRMARLPDEPNDINAYLRLRDQVGMCMSSRGYTAVGDLKYLGGCDARCLYP